MSDANEIPQIAAAATPSREFTRILMSLQQTKSECDTVLRISRSSIENADETLMNDLSRQFELLIDDKSNDGIFKDKASFMREIGGAGGYAMALQKHMQATYAGAVDAAIIVLMHAALDDAITALLRVALIASPRCFLRHIKSKQVSIEDILNNSVDEIIRRESEDLINKVSKDSMKSRIGRLLDICSRESKEHAHQQRPYDQAELIRIDRLRQGIVHRPFTLKPIIGADDIVRRLYDAGLFLCGCIAQEFKVLPDISMGIFAMMKPNLSDGPTG